MASAAIFVCAVMALVAAAPLVAGDIHDVTKGAKGPNASAVTWSYTPTDYGMWHAKITNNGLRWMVVEVYDNSSGAPVLQSKEHIRFAAYDVYPTGVVDSASVIMAAGREYQITVVPNGPKGSTATVEDVFEIKAAPVAQFTAAMDWMTASVDASGSYDPDLGTIVSYDWNWGDGMTESSAVATATHTYAAEGTYTITLTVTDNDALVSDPATQIVDAVMEPAQVSASFTANIVYLDLSVDASASTGVLPLSFAWDFGDGMTGTGVTASHSYAAAGTYTVTLTVTDANMATATASKDVTATEVPPLVPPVASFTANIVYLDLSVDASASSDVDGTVVAWAWDFGDGATASSKTATHSYAAAGDFTVTLTVTDNDGLTGTASKQVTAVEPPIPPVASFTADITYLDLSVDASASSDPDGALPLTFAWNFGDGTMGSGVTATHSYAAGGDYTVTLTVTDADGLSDTDVQVVTAVEPPKPPVASFEASADYLVVSVDGSGSSDPDGTVVAWAWDFGDGATATGETATHEYAAAGTYLIKLTVTDSQDLTDDASQSVTVVENTAPVAAFTFEISGQTVTFNAAGSTDDRGIATYDWNFGDDTTGTGIAPSHTYSPPVGSSVHIIASSGVLAPVPPYTLVGVTYGPDGVTPMGDSVVTITNTANGMSMTVISYPVYGIIWDPVKDNYPDLNELSVVDGNVISVTATNGPYSGTATAIAHPALGELDLNVVMTGTGPVTHDFTVTLTVTDGYGLSNSVSQVVTIEF